MNYVADATAPGGSALQLTTDATDAAKAQYLHASSTPLSAVNELAYSTKQNSASFVNGAPSYQLLVNLDGTAATSRPSCTSRPRRRRRRSSRRLAELGRRRGPVLVEPHRHGTAPAWSPPAPAARRSTRSPASGDLPERGRRRLRRQRRHVQPELRRRDRPRGLQRHDVRLRARAAAPTSKDQCKNGGWQTLLQPGVQEPGRLRQLHRHGRQERPERLSPTRSRLTRGPAPAGPLFFPLPASTTAIDSSSR